MCQTCFLTFSTQPMSVAFTNTCPCGAVWDFPSKSAPQLHSRSSELEVNWKATSGIKLLHGEKACSLYLSGYPGENAIMEKEELRRLSGRDKNLYSAAGGASLSTTEGSGTYHPINHEPRGKSQLTSASFGIISLSVPLHWSLNTGDTHTYTEVTPQG